MNRKIRIIYFLTVLVLIIILFQLFIQSRTIYLGNDTKIFNLNNIYIKLNHNSNIKIRNVYTYKNGKRLNGYLKSTKVDNIYEYNVVSKNNRIIQSDDLIASGKLIKLDVVSNKYSKTEINESLLQEFNELTDNELSINNIIRYKKITYDIDNDSSDESIIFVTYLSNGSLNNKAFINDDNVIDIINDEYDIEKQDNLETNYRLVGLIDFNKDKKYETVVSTSKGDDSPTYYNVYRYVDGTVKEIK